jgi:hypothetical protein
MPESPVYPWIRSGIETPQLAGPAFGRLTTDIAFLPDRRDLAETCLRYSPSREIGLTADAALCGPHVETVNEMLDPVKAAVRP